MVWAKLSIVMAEHLLWDIQIPLLVEEGLFRHHIYTSFTELSCSVHKAEEGNQIQLSMTAF